MTERHRCDDGAFPCENDLYDWGEQWSPFGGHHRLSTGSPTSKPLQGVRHQPDHDRMTHTLDQAYLSQAPPEPLSPAYDHHMADVSAPSAGFFKGRWMLKVVPTSTLDWIVMLPRCSRAILRDTASPRPVPLPTPLVVKNGSKTLWRVSSSMPSPVSLTLNIT